jgi:hypothetical protein
MKQVVFLFILIFVYSLPLTAEFMVCGESGIQLEPTVGFDGTNYIVFWTDGRDSLEQIYGTRITTTGVVLDSGGFQVITEREEQISPSVAFDGTNYLVVWQYDC